MLNYRVLSLLQARVETKLSSDMIAFTLILSPRNDVTRQIKGVSHASQRGYKTVREAKLAFKQHTLEGHVKACPDSYDPSVDGVDLSDVSVVPDAATRANQSRNGSTNTPASSASNRGSPARERAQPRSTRSQAHTKSRRPPTPPTETNSSDEEEDEARRESRAPGRERDDRRRSARVREESPHPPPTRRESTRVKTEPPPSRAREPPRTPSARKKQVNTTPVPVQSDSDPEVPLQRSPPRRNPEAPSTGSRRAQVHEEYISFVPGGNESISSPPKVKRRAPIAPGLTRESSYSTQYHTAASSLRDIDENVARHGAGRRRTASSVSTTSSPPTEVSQYEDPEGGVSLHEQKRADIEAKREARGKKPVQAPPAPEEVPTELESADDDYVPPAVRRARSEPIVEPTRPNTPLTPVPLAKSKSMPPSVNTNARMSMRYKACRACLQPVPEPPIFRPEGPSSSAAACDRCYQPLPKPATSMPKSPASSHRSFKSARKPPPELSESESEDTEVRMEEEDFLSTLGLSPAPMLFDVLNPANDPRSPIRGPIDIPVP